ncbi:PTS ascorbate transporter subunit IIC [Olsenella sp. YH-ols2217]|uniref:Ascorbate-specific PTS system EIIC component n=1 Tax=Kribbibacterium absianum TaxID=3044210 RepID=A0ABT6ZJZ3_9ACTN|nr:MULTISPECIES: PTS ascorbate transporter subunit IIC [unclassified Olsenella]MDJ1122365.1 PTS ascorbate transporter subunit IIC [Olsenella sp. YH-ols2216]MDJ1129381.1 PTS ascorbate transporter subunit IIC [Olsenella sp. YH-ols2217]
MDAVLDFIVNILSTPAILVGLLSLLGLVLQKKPVEDVVSGTIKTIVGFLVLSAGAAFLQSGSLLAFGEVFNYAFNMQGVVPNNEAVVSMALSDFGQASAVIMCLGMVLNIVLARFSRLPYIFLTGHHTLYMACMLAVVFSIGGLTGWPLYIAGACVLGLIMAVSPALCQFTFKKVTKTDSIALGHFGGIGYFIAGLCGKPFKGSKSTEDINFPKRLVFLRDTVVSISITMMIFFVIVTGVAVGRGILSADPSQFSNLNELLNVGTETHTNWLVWALTSGMSFAGGVYIILSGVRLVVGEIVPAFKGIATKLVPGAIPAIDCPVAFPYAPNAVIIGFLVSFVGGIVGLAILGVINAAIVPVALILPGVVPHFFCGATAGVFGNAEGGLKGCMLGAFVHGLLITFLPAICMPVFTQLGFTSATFSDFDFSILGICFGNLANIIPGWPILVVTVACFLAPIVYALVAPKKPAGGETAN